MSEEEDFKPIMGRFIDPLTDKGFKIIFGTEPNKELLISFLNEIFKGRKKIIDLDYKNNEKFGPQKDFRGLSYDLICTNQDGVSFILEMQLLKQENFKDRTIYYTSSLIHEQGTKGNKKWQYQLKEVWLIGLMNFRFDNSQREKYLHWVHLKEEDSDTIFYEKLGYLFIELPNFIKKEEELETVLDRWLFLLKNLGKMENISVNLSTTIFEKLFKIAEISRLTKEEYMEYERSLWAKWNEYANYTSALAIGKEEGKKEGKEEGIKEGKEKGIKEGEEKGKFESKEEVVKNLLVQTDFTIEKIASIANVSLDFVNKAKNNNLK